MSESDLESALLAKERQILELRERHESLERIVAERRSQLNLLHQEVDGLVRQLAAVGRSRVEFGDLRRTVPISPVWGVDRGTPVDRYYVHRFLDRHRSDIAGRVLEVKDPGYTRAYGDDRVTASEVLDIDPSNPYATLVVDLSKADAIPDDSFDCFVLTQTLGVVYDVAAAVRHAVRILKPNGVLLCTLPASGRISYEEGLRGDFWRFTEGSVRRLFADVLPESAFTVEGHGNVLACAAFLYGLALHELSTEELDAVDPYFPLVYTVRAVKPACGGRRLTLGAARDVVAAAESAILTYHRVGPPAYEGDRLSLSVVEFEAQLQWLHESGVRVVPLADLAESTANGARGEWRVSLTFDDGYVDALTTAMPLLERYGFPATFFVVGAALEGALEFWWDAVDRIFRSADALPDRLRLPSSLGDLDLATRDQTERLSALERVKTLFYQWDREQRSAALQALHAWSGTRPRFEGERRPMTASEVTALAARPGVSIGCHSHSHLWLPRLSDAELTREIGGGRAHLERLLGTRVAAFSYPYGACDDRTVDAVRQAGFDVAVTTEARRLSLASDRRRLPRVDMSAASYRELAARLAPDALGRAL